MRVRGGYVTRSIICIAIGLVLATVSAPAYADDAAPTPEQLDQAKKAYGEGKALHDAGKLTEAVDKFKESYRLSKNPLLLYNIGFTLDEAKQKDLALFYYRKFLSDAPKEAKQRGEVTDRVKALEQEFMDHDLTKPDATKPDVPKKAIKPAGTYSATDFQHEVVEEAPPNQPLDVTAFVPDDSGFTVTLYYRIAGDSTFTAKVMKWRYKELTARIPASKMTGSSIQYYVEARDQANKEIARSGKSTSPNLVNLDAGAKPRFYPDITDETTDTGATGHRDDEDPLHHRSDSSGPIEVQPQMPGGSGLMDVGSSKFRYAKLGTTIGAGVMLGLSIVFYVEASNQAKNLANDSNMCGTPPCRNFDTFDQDVQSSGQRDQTISRVAISIGIVSAGVAAYFWYRELTAKKRGERTVSTRGNGPESTWIVTPAVSEGFAGAAATGSF